MSDAASRYVRLRTDFRPNRADNTGTVLAALPAFGFDAARLFTACFTQIERAMAGHPSEPGLLTLAFDRAHRVLGQLWLRSDQQYRTAIIGRHSACDLVIPPEHDTVSLRHVAVVVRREDRTQIRFVDLHTASGIEDEFGNSLRSIEADGPLFLSVGSIYLVVLMTGTPIPTDPAEAYAAIPRRHPVSVVEEPHDEGTVVRDRGIPAFVRPQLCRGTARGFLTAHFAGQTSIVPVGCAALESGVIIGRYPRCDLAVSSSLSSLSRVQLLLLAVDRDVLAIDCASTNGMFAEGEQHRIVVLRSGSELGLPGGLVLSWNDAN
jgi:hypothetical protein